MDREPLLEKRPNAAEFGLAHAVVHVRHLAQYGAEERVAVERGGVGFAMPGAARYVVQPLQQAFEAIPERTLEAAATLRASPLDRFFSVALPLARPGLVTAAVLGFTHTVGEFGVVLMIGGNIPDKTRVVSVQIYDHVEAMDYAAAHGLAAGMVAFAFLVLLALYTFNPARRKAL